MKRFTSFVALILAGTLVFYIWRDNTYTAVTALGSTVGYTRYIGILKWAIVISGVLLLLPLLFKAIRKHTRKRRYLNSEIRKIDRMKGTEFEEYLEAHFSKLGYRVDLTPVSNDFGADLIMTKNKVKVAVQAKRYSDKVGNAAIQEIVASLKYYNADRGMVITNSYFTKNAKTLARVNGVELWDRDRLIKEFQVK